MLRKLLRIAFLGKVSKNEALIWHRHEEISSKSDAGVFKVRILMVWYQFELELDKIMAAACQAACLVLSSLFVLSVNK